MNEQEEIITITVIQKKEKGGQYSKIVVNGELSDFSRENVIQKMLDGKQIRDLRIILK